MKKHPEVSKTTRGRAKELRSRTTYPERRLWKALRNRRLADLKFVRQEPIGPYIVDFCCLSHKLIVEVDGAHHHESDHRAYDEDRTAYLEANGFRVLRFDNADVMQDVEGVVGRILHPLSGSPLCGGARGVTPPSPPCAGARAG